MIFLHKPYVETKNSKSKLIFDLEIDEDKKQVWYEVDKKYGKFLCDDRVDAIFVGILHYAMENNHDIKSDSYVTDDLLFKVQEYLIPSLSKYGKGLYPVKIEIKTKKAVKNEGGVGTGCSCGVDSLHAYIMKSHLDDKKYNITHLCINNVGSFNETYKDEGIDKVRQEVINKAKKFAKDVKLPIIISNSNIQEEIPQVHLYTHVYSSTFAIMCLQKLWSIYYYGSAGYDLSYFSIIDNDTRAAGYYDLLSFYCFSNSSLQIYSEGMEKMRFEKIKDIYKNPLFKKHLHICLKKGHNCNVCDKCRRTLLCLYSLADDLDEYKEIFDIDYFYNHIDEYFEWIYNEHLYYVYHPNSNSNEVTYQELLKKDDFKKFVLDKGIVDENMDINYYVKEVERLNFELNEITNSAGYKLLNKIYATPVYNKIKQIRNKDK